MCLVNTSTVTVFDSLKLTRKPDMDVERESLIAIPVLMMKESVNSSHSYHSYSTISMLSKSMRIITNNSFKWCEGAYTTAKIRFRTSNNNTKEKHIGIGIGHTTTINK